MIVKILKYSVVLSIILLLQLEGKSQSVGIGTNTPNPNAKLDIVDTSKGLLIPRMSSNQRKKIPNVKGLIVFDNESSSFWYNDGRDWRELLPTTTDKSNLTLIYLSS